MKPCIGITGNLGSGKSTVAQLFKSLGAGLVSADQISRRLTLPHEAAYHEIVKHFGDEILNNDTTLNRGQLRQRITANPTERKWLEELLHPLIRAEIAKEIAEQKAPYVVIEIPLLQDKKDYPYLTRVLVVVADEDLQIMRTTARDNVSEEDARRLLAAQPSLANRLTIADDIIPNHHDLNALEEKVKALHEQYLRLAN